MKINKEYNMRDVLKKERQVPAPKKKTFMEWSRTSDVFLFIRISEIFFSSDDDDHESLRQTWNKKKIQYKWTVSFRFKKDHCAELRDNNRKFYFQLKNIQAWDFWGSDFSFFHFCNVDCVTLEFLLDSGSLAVTLLSFFAKNFYLLYVLLAHAVLIKLTKRRL